MGEENKKKLEKFMITSIINEAIDNLVISEDDMGDGPVAVFLYTPSMADTGNHYHIPMKLEQATELRDWLIAWTAKFVVKYGCNRCGHIQDTGAQCESCEWGDLYPVKA